MTHQRAEGKYPVVVTTAAAATTAAALANGVALGAIVMVLLMAALFAKEVAAHAGDARLVPLSRALNVAVIPLTAVVILVLAQQLTGLL